MSYPGQNGPMWGQGGCGGPAPQEEPLVEVTLRLYGPDRGPATTVANFDVLVAAAREAVAGHNSMTVAGGTDHGGTFLSVKMRSPAPLSDAEVVKLRGLIRDGR